MAVDYSVHSINIELDNKNFGFNTIGSHGWVNMEEYGSSGIIRNYLF